ncbi:MAG: YggS family pyridoxal phosphate-dependent enzyme [Clostridiales bacterium]|nr:YggS family pyridoxal phosphate-dependent enzyme [Clostridiales bacterium]
MSGLIEANVKALLKELPTHVVLVAAAKSRAPEEILEAVRGGVKIIGENYVQEALAAFQVVGRQAEWHFIGHLQRNKVKKAVEFFDLIETVDSLDIGQEISKRSAARGKVTPILVEINSGREPQKFGVMPEEAKDLVKQLGCLPSINVQGLMTMGPEFGDPEEARPYFRVTREIFEEVKATGFPGVEMKWLSMGMSHSYRVAIEEGANMVRIGTKIFGPRS